MFYKNAIMYIAKEKVKGLEQQTFGKLGTEVLSVIVFQCWK